MDQLQLGPLLRDYLSYMLVKKGRARSASHLVGVQLRVSRMLQGAARLEDVTPDFVEARMRELLETPVLWRGRLRRRSTQTVDNHRRELGTFFRWAVRRRIAPSNPVDFVESYETADMGESSRPFSPSEAAAFFSGVRERRLLVYLLWATSGLRPAETKRLRWTQVVLAPSDGLEPYLQLTRAGSKNRKAVRQPLHPEVVALLGPLRDRAVTLEAPVFDTIPTEKTFVRDLVLVGLERARVTPEGRLTRTSLRKLFATSLDRDGASEGLVQKLMRHSTPTLTRERYTHFDLGEKSEHVQRLSFLPDWRRSGPEIATA